MTTVVTITQTTAAASGIQNAVRCARSRGTANPIASTRLSRFTPITIHPAVCAAATLE